MKEFRRCVQLQSNDNDVKIKIVVALLTISFFFELEIISLLKSKHYECRDFVRCRNDDQTIIATLFRLLEFHLEFSTNTTILNKISQNDICKTCRLYRRKVIVRIRHLEDVVNLYIKFNVTKRRKINEFFYNMS